MALFGSDRDVSLIRKLNRELLGNIISQQASIYKFKLKETEVNIYGEADEEKFYNGPFLFNCLIKINPQNYFNGEIGVDLDRSLSFAFLRDDLIDNNIVIEIGDIILFEEKYYGVENVVENQYFLGKDPQYPNESNPINPGLNKFGNNLSTIVKGYYIPADKVNITEYKERF